MGGQNVWQWVTGWVTGGVRGSVRRTLHALKYSALLPLVVATAHSYPVHTWRIMHWG